MGFIMGKNIVIRVGIHDTKEDPLIGQLNRKGKQRTQEKANMSQPDGLRSLSVHLGEMAFSAYVRETSRPKAKKGISAFGRERLSGLWPRSPDHNLSEALRP